MIDAFATRYGWRRDEVLDLYPDEAGILLRIIKSRAAEEKLHDLAVQDWNQTKRARRSMITRDLREQMADGNVITRAKCSPEVEAKIKARREELKREFGGGDA